MIKVGLIGCGAVGQMHLANLKKLEKCQKVKVVAVADKRPELLQLVANQYGILNRYASHRELLDSSEDLDAVVIVVHRHNTFEVVLDCLKAGVDVFVEKPLAMTSFGARTLEGTAKVKELKLHVGHQRQHDFGVHQAALKFAWLLNTQKLLHARYWNFTGKDRMPAACKTIMTDEIRPMAIYDMPDWLSRAHHEKYDRAINVICHDVNLMNAFLPGPKKLKSCDLGNPGAMTARFKATECDIDLLFGFNELLPWNDRLPWHEGFEFYFEKARLKVELGAPLVHDQCARVELSTPKSGVEIICDGQVSGMSAFEYELDYFVTSENLTNGGLASDDILMIESMFKAQYLTT